MFQFTTSRAIAILGLFALAVLIAAVAATDGWLRHLSEEKVLAIARRDAAVFRTLYAGLAEPMRTDVLLVAVQAYAIEASAARGDVGAGSAAPPDPVVQQTVIVPLSRRGLPIQSLTAEASLEHCPKLW